MRSIVIIGAILIAVVIGISSMAYSEDFLISQDNSAAEQNNPAVAVGLGGKFAVVWYDYRNGNGDVYCRLYDSGAMPIGQEFILNDDSISAWQMEPDLSSDWFGNYYAVWKDYRNSSYPFDPDIYFQKLDSNGVLDTNSNITIELPDSSHQSPAIGSAGWGKSVVTWTDLRNYNWDIFVQYLDMDGLPSGNNKLVNDDNTITPQHEPDVAISPEGWFVVSWYDKRNGNDDIYIQKFDSSGKIIGANKMVNSGGGSSKQKFPSVAVGGNGAIYVVWNDWRNGAYPDNADIYCQRFDSNLNALGGNVMINRDGTYFSQRYPKISADRMGNACVIWSDSSVSGWDIMGQMIEHGGTFHEGNFFVNNDAAGNQLKGDVALDGYDLYFTWVDNRNGNYDIYGRVKHYNNPSLLTFPNQVDISRDISDPDSGEYKIIIQNAGYGELLYRLRSSVNWAVLSKTSGSTPDSFYITFNTSGMSYGMQLGYISLIDVNHADSNAIMPISYSITGPVIEMGLDTLNLVALAGMGLIEDQSIQITNAGSGELNWQIAVSEDWINTDVSSGVQGDFVSISCDIAILTEGIYQGYIIASDAYALNSPESLMVIVEYIDNVPYLSTESDSLNYFLLPDQYYTDSIQIFNLASGFSQWKADSPVDWMRIDNSSGGDNDYIIITVGDSLLLNGYYSSSITIVDTNAYNTPLTIPVSMLISEIDTVFVSPVSVTAGGAFQSQVYLYNTNETSSGNLRFGFDNLMVRIDSLVPPKGELKNRVAMSIDTMDNTFGVEINEDLVIPLIEPGRYHLCDIYATANDTINGITNFEAVIADSMFCLIIHGAPAPPILDAGDIEISGATAISDIGEHPQNSIFELYQNHPNPFNAGTTISFSLARSGNTSLIIYNILGQPVKTLLNQYMPSGTHQIAWNGNNSNETEVASGIYLYRLKTESRQIVKKLVFSK